MLVRIVDIKEKVHWVNPIHVKVVTQGKKNVTLICIKHEIAWGSAVPVIKTNQPIDEVAELLNLAMPDSLTSFVPDDDDADDASGGAIATGAVVM